ncbi:MAG TPA: hypothetical protein PK765_01290 [bacterium]|nr:hypothetical protein [bacterium]
MSNLRDGEKIQLVLRRHWIVYAMLAGWAIILIGMTGSLLSYAPAITAAVGVSIYGIALVTLWMSFLFFLYLQWLNQELDLCIVTTHRVVGVEQVSFLDRKVSECSLDEVQEVNAESKGLLANIFNYGTIYINTASERSSLRVLLTPDSLGNARDVLNVIDEHRKGRRGAVEQSQQNINS